MMFAIGIRYLNGWAMAAADGAKKEQVEWPPHPDRVFMALAAAHFEGERSEATRELLEWLEQLPSPALAASDCTARQVVTHYVPTNDASAPAIKAEQIHLASAEQVGSGVSLLPERRSRQARQFPTAIPHDDIVHLIWRDVDLPAARRDALQILCSQVTSIGHSASLVQVWIADDPPAPRWIPAIDQVPEVRMRVPSAGRLKILEQAFNETERLSWIELERAIESAKGKQRKALIVGRGERFGGRQPAVLRPPSGHWMGYAQAKPDHVGLSAAAANVFSENMLIFRQIGGTRLGPESTLLLTSIFRDYVLKICAVQPPPEWVSGHAAEGTPSRVPHLAFLPLPHVGHAHADGHLLGVALAVPKQISSREIGQCLALLFELDDKRGDSRPFTLYSGALLESTFQFDLAHDSPRALQPETWIAERQGARTWASVTPIVLDRHGRTADPWQEAEGTIRIACQRVGLPDPVHIVLGPVSHFIGAPPTIARRGGYPFLLRKDGGRRHQLHAVLTFPEPIRGPVLIGAGRFRGYGLCRPWPSAGYAR